MVRVIMVLPHATQNARKCTGCKICVVVVWLQCFLAGCCVVAAAVVVVVAVAWMSCCCVPWCCGCVLRRCAAVRCAAVRSAVLRCAVLWCAVLLCWGSAALCCRGVVVCRSAVPWCCVPCHGTSTNRYENTRDAHCVNGQENFIKYLKYIIRCMQLCVAER
jgi:hypothetical protein